MARRLRSRPVVCWRDVPFVPAFSGTGGLGLFCQNCILELKPRDGGRREAVRRVGVCGCQRADGDRSSLQPEQALFCCSGDDTEICSVCRFSGRRVATRYLKLLYITLGVPDASRQQWIEGVGERVEQFASEKREDMSRWFSDPP